MSECQIIKEHRMDEDKMADRVREEFGVSRSIKSVLIVSCPKRHVTTIKVSLCM